MGARSGVRGGGGITEKVGMNEKISIFHQICNKNDYVACKTDICNVHTAHQLLILFISLLWVFLCSE